VIAMMTALLYALRVCARTCAWWSRFCKVMTNGHLAYVMLALITYLISPVFWPTQPAVPLVAAVLLPAAIAAGLPPLACAMAIAIAGQGMALSSDYVIGVAPGISARPPAPRSVRLSWATARCSR
jgi:predicted histidine transporter YuiF (NhaC family)